MPEERRAVTSTTAPVRVLRVRPGGSEHRADTVVVEEPLQVHLVHRGSRLMLGSTMRTPGQDLDLAVGLAVGEGVVQERTDVAGVRHCAPGSEGAEDNDVTVTLADDVELDVPSVDRVRRPTSACGVCGRDEIDALVARVRPVTTDLQLAVGIVADLPERMVARQSVFRRTGGLHAAALASADGEIQTVREDVGRHNAVDKVVGDALLRALDSEVLVVSGRAGFEIVQKAAMAGIPVVVAVSAPTSLAVDVARACGLTLAAFVRDGRMSVYSGSQRLVDSSDPAAPRLETIP